jgi:hypothetical protein
MASEPPRRPLREAPALARTTGGLLIVTAVVYTGAFTALAVAFDYPEILRRPTGEILERFAAGGPGLVSLWYLLVLAALLFVPIAVLLDHVLRDDRDPANDRLALAPTLGVLAGLVQALGLSRWPFLVPSLSAAFLDPAASAGTREAAAVVFEAFHRYLGVAVGEHLGYLFTGAWTLLVARRLERQPGFGRAFAWSGIVAGVGILFGVLEYAGLAVAGVVNAAGYLLWSVWLVGIGIRLLILSGRTEAR